MAASENLKKKVEKALSGFVREVLSNGADVRVEKSDYRNYLHVYLTSERFAKIPSKKRGELIWQWLQENLDRSELVKITLVSALTPEEEERLIG